MRVSTFVTLVGVLVVCWVMVVPPSAGPDEPGHLVRSAALVRGDLDGSPSPTNPVIDQFQLPAWIGAPDPACFAFHPDVAATCAIDLPMPEGTANLQARQADYPIWGHLLPGIGTLAPQSSSIWISRLLAALVPVLLVGVSLARSATVGRLAASATMLALTPMAWFMFAVVNPSALAISGGLALWVGSSDLERDRIGGRLAAAGWAALVLPRRDGLAWACLVLIAVLLADRRSLSDWWRRLGTGPRLLVALSIVAAELWAITSDMTINRFAALAPATVLLVELVRTSGRRWIRTPRQRILASSLLGSSVVVVAAVLLEWRPTVDATSIVGNTGRHLNEAIGVLGWLDTPVPTTAVYLWLLAFGLLVAAMLVGPDSRNLAIVGGIVVAAVAVSWAFQLVHGDGTNPYWQGRYYLPLLVGSPLLLGRATIDAAAERRFAIAVGAAAAVVWNVAFMAGIRRWSVGVSGSMLPWHWDTYDAPLPPILFIVVHLVVSAGLLRSILRPTLVVAPAVELTGRAAGRLESSLTATLRRRAAVSSAG